MPAPPHCANLYRVSAFGKYTVRLYLLWQLADDNFHAPSVAFNWNCARHLCLTAIERYLRNPAFHRLCRRKLKTATHYGRKRSTTYDEPHGLLTKHLASPSVRKTTWPALCRYTEPQVARGVTAL